MPLRPTGSEIVAVALMKDELAALTSNTTAVPAICLVWVCPVGVIRWTNETVSVLEGV